MRTLCLLLFAAVGSAVLAQEPATPDQAEIDEVNRLGRLLYAYDQAAWHGTDAVLPLFPPGGEGLRERVHGYVAEPVGAGWRVSFGRLSPDGARFLAAYEARLDSAYAVLGAEAFPEPVAREGFPRDAMHALDAGRERFEPPTEVTYNTAVLPAPGGRVYVYYLPAQPAWDIYYVGADVRYTFDPDAGTITDERRLHSGLHTFDLREQSDAETFSSAVLTDIPTETDVFYAMSRPGRGPNRASHYVLTDDWVFFLDRNGVSAMLTREAWLRLGAGGED